MAAAKKRRKYTQAERDAVLADVEKLGVCAAAREHGIPQTSVSNWLTRGQPRMTSSSEEKAAIGVVLAQRERAATRTVGTTTRSSRVARSYTPSQKALILEDAAKDGVTEASKKHGVSRFSIYDWQRKVARAAKGEGASPTSGPAPEEIEAQRDREILAEWRKHPGLGPSQIRNQLRRAGVKVSVATARRVMEDAGYRPPKVKREPHDERYEAVRPNQQRASTILSNDGSCVARPHQRPISGRRECPLGQPRARARRRSCRT